MRSKPPLRNSAALAHHRSSAGSCAPRPTASVAERRREPRPAVVLPHVHRLRPRAGGADQCPHAVAELVALFLADRAPVRGHVLHVVRAVVPDDVDELVDVDAVVHRRSPCSAGFGQQLPRVALGIERSAPSDRSPGGASARSGRVRARRRPPWRSRRRRRSPRAERGVAPAPGRNQGSTVRRPDRLRHAGRRASAARRRAGACTPCRRRTRVDRPARTP